MISKRLDQQMDFLFEIEKLKIVYRQNGILGGSRQENSAEHSWHISIMALVLQEYCSEKVDLTKVVKMLLIHDLVEIYVGDTFLYDQEKREQIKAAEAQAAEKIFSLLPEDQKTDFLDTWTEFEKNESKEARYALVLDNLQPLMNHYYTNNQNITGKALKKSQVIEKKKCIKEFSEELWEFALKIIDACVEKGLFHGD